MTIVIIGNGVTSIDFDAFFGCSNLEIIYYGGTESEWSQLSYTPEYGTVYYYSETQPTTIGNYWHYVNGVPSKW